VVHQLDALAPALLVGVDDVPDVLADVFLIVPSARRLLGPGEIERLGQVELDVGEPVRSLRRGDEGFDFRLGARAGTAGCRGFSVPGVTGVAGPPSLSTSRLPSIVIARISESPNFRCTFFPLTVTSMTTNLSSAREDLPSMVAPEVDSTVSARAVIAAAKDEQCDQMKNGIVKSLVHLTLSDPEL